VHVYKRQTQPKGGGHTQCGHPHLNLIPAANCSTQYFLSRSHQMQCDSRNWVLLWWWNGSGIRGMSMLDMAAEKYLSRQQSICTMCCRAA